MSRSFAVCAAVIVVATVVISGCQSRPSSEASESSSDAISTTQGDWSLLGDGQCLVAMQNFYPAKFGAYVPNARSSYTGSCADEGACHIWYDDIPDPSVWTRIPNDGSSLPSLYDLVVYPETQQNPWGHIASVDHVEDGVIYVMDSNFAGDERRSTSPHAVARAPLGWYRLKALGGAPSASPSANTCGNLAARRGWSSPLCEQASSSNAYSRVACNGTGEATDDCTRCCDAGGVGPSHTDESCGVYAARMGFREPRCELGTNACNGSGPSTGDGCTHCCDTP